MTLLPAGPRQQFVGDLANQHVLEAELLLALDDRGRVAHDQVALLECAEQRREAVPVVHHPLERAAPKSLAGDRGVEHQRPLPRGKGVEPCSDDSANRRRQRVGRGAGLAHRGRELLDEQRVALGRAGQAPGLLAPELSEPHHRELPGFFRAERSQGQRRVSGQASAPRGPSVEQLRPGLGEKHDRQVAQPRRQQLDQVEQAAVRPVDVFEHERDRLVLRHGLDEDAHREEELLAVVDRALRIEAEQDREVRGDLLVADALAELCEPDLCRVALEDSAELLDLAREGEVGAALSIRQRAAADAAAAELSDDALELLRQPCLADSRWAEDGDEMGHPLAGDPLPDAAQDIQLALAPDEHP